MKKKTKFEKVDEPQIVIESVETDTMTRATEQRERVELASFIWTLISAVYTIASVIFFIINKWIPSQFNATLIILLCAFVLAFIVILAMTFSKRDSHLGVKALRVYRKTLLIFKNAVYILFLVITAVSMVGIANETSPLKWIVFVVTFSVAFIQLVLRIAVIVGKIMLRRQGKNMKVQVVTFVNGKMKEHKAHTNLLKKLYHTDDDNE